MARYIDAAKAVERIRKQQSESIARECAVNAVNNTPAEDVAPVVHAYWNKRGDEWAFPYDCSNCGHGLQKRTPYCPFCGAIMDAEGGDK